ncbi:MAG: AAA family ATPase [Chloroflexota bacterium]
MIGRRGEIALLERYLENLDRGAGGAIALAGEPGIGKTALLAELRARTAKRHHLVLAGTAAEPERHVPFSVFVDAFDDHLASLGFDDLTGLGEPELVELAHVFPSMSSFGRGHPRNGQRERYRTHRAVRALIEQLARDRRLVVILDDWQWADPASIELLEMLLRRPPAAAVLIALAFRPRSLADRSVVALERAERLGTLERVELRTLGADGARQLVGEDVSPLVAQQLYDESGGNPFYLQQLARSLDRAMTVTVDGGTLPDIGVPSAVAAALAEERGSLTDLARRVFDGAAVAGDPFDLGLAADAAATSEVEVRHALDELLGADLVRSTDVSRRFRFRHPLLHRAAYVSSPAAWRIEAHARCANALARRGAPAAMRAHHVERSAAYGDLEAVAALKQAGDSVARLAPESAARWFDVALGLLPASASGTERVGLLVARSAALSASGHVTAGHDALLDALSAVPDGAISLFATVTAACAREERLIGRYESAHARLVDALRRLPGPPSREAVALLIELTLNEFYRSRYDEMDGWARRAAATAAEVDDPAVLAAALAMPALADAVNGEPERARSIRDQAAAMVDTLPDEVLARRVDAATWLAATELYLDMYIEADAHASRALEVTSSTGHDPVGLYQILPRVWYVRGKLLEAAEMLDGAIDGGRLLGTPPSLAGNLFNRSAVALAAGDLPLAYATADEGARLASRLGRGFVPAWAAVRLAAVLLELGEAERASELLLAEAGEGGLTLIPGGWRVYCLELLTRCLLASHRRAAAERTAELAISTADTVRLPLATAWADRAVATTALEAGDMKTAADRALTSADRAAAIGAPIEAALSRELAGRALARAGAVDEAVDELRRAAAAFDATGALRYRGRTEQELGKLGHRPHRRTRHGLPASHGVESLTERELQVARLVVERKTNPEIAAELFLSQKTVESHLRNVFNKVGVESRVSLARLIERSLTGSAPGSL